MAVFQEPTQWDHELGNNADVSTLPDDTSATTGVASLQKLFQLINQTPLEAGGVAPSREDFNALLKKARKGTVPERMAAYDEIYGSVEEMVQPSMVALWKEAMNADKNNISGSASKYVMTCASVEAYEKINERKFDEGAQVFQKYSEDNRLSGEEKQTLLFYSAQVLLSSGNAQYDKIALVLQAAIDADPESQYAETLKSYLAEMESNKAAVEAASANEK